MFGDQGLVGGHHRLAPAERGLHRGLGRTVRAADQLDEDIDLIGRGERNRIVEPAQGRDVHRTRPRTRPGGHPDDLCYAARRGEPGVVRQELEQARADRAQPGDAQTPFSIRHPGSYCAAMAVSRLKSASALFRNFFTLRAACRIRCSFSTNPMRT